MHFLRVKSVQTTIHSHCLIPSICVFFVNDPCYMFHEPIGNSRRFSFKVFCLDRISFFFTAVYFSLWQPFLPLNFFHKHMDVPFVFFRSLHAPKKANFSKKKRTKVFEIEWIFVQTLSFITHRIRVWYIYLHLVVFDVKCRWIYHTWILWVMLYKAFVQVNFGNHPLIPTKRFL